MNKRFSNPMDKIKDAMAKGKHLVKNGGWKLSSKEASKLFDVYYECQRLKIEALQKEDFPIKAVLAVEGERVELTCHVCYRPDQSRHHQAARWQFLRHEDSGLTHVTPGRDSRVKVTEVNSLVIKSVDVKDAGQYFCVEKDGYAAVWQLDVFLTDRRKFVRVGEDVPQTDNILWARNLRVFTMWGAWSECNTCDRMGQRSRVGQCTVKKIYADTPIFPRDYPLMQLYPSGVPCHSTALPRHIRRSPDIGQRDSETMVSPCNETCPTEPPARVVTDEDGKVIEVIAPGFHSSDEKPELPPLVKRRVKYEPEDSHLVLQCPGDLDKSMLRWQKGDRDVEPASIKHQTAGRVWIDSLARLHFNPLLLSDTAVYNCWEKTRRVASIKLLVVDRRGADIKLYISYMGLAATVLGGLGIFCCLCCSRKNKNAA